MKMKDTVYVLSILLSLAWLKEVACYVEGGFSFRGQIYGSHYTRTLKKVVNTDIVDLGIANNHRESDNELKECAGIHHNRNHSDRRKFMNLSFSVVGSLPCLLLRPTPTVAAENIEVVQEKLNEKLILKGKVTLQSGTTVPEDISTSALYVTARPNNPVDVPRAILDGSNGKPPPVLAVRFTNVEFPYSFDLTTSDLTVEGNAYMSSSSNNGEEKYWWEGKDLIVSARFDTDGVAATRDPTDLVGRDLFVIGNEGVSIQLQGRGITGKLFTGKSNR